MANSSYLFCHAIEYCILIIIMGVVIDVGRCGRLHDYANCILRAAYVLAGRARTRIVSARARDYGSVVATTAVMGFFLT